MSKTPTIEFHTVGDLLERLGDISPSRILLKPVPGIATEADLLYLLERKIRICELIEGTLVEKAMGFAESSLAMWIGHLLFDFLAKHDLGTLGGEAGALRLMQGLVRVPDVSFIRWEKLPDRHAAMDRLPAMAPDLAIEVLSDSNTVGEMTRKRREYFLAGTEAVWIVDPVKRTIAVYSDPETSTTLTEADTLDGGSVLPGLNLAVCRVFERLPPMKKTPRRKKT